MPADKEYMEDELYLTKISMGFSAVFALISITVLIKICRGSRHPFFIQIIVLELVALLLIILREASYIIAVQESNGFKENYELVEGLTIAHAIFSSLSCLAFLTVRWLFSLKYLIVSKEMPGLFRGEVANYEQTGRYKFWKLCMMIGFSLVTLWNMVFTYRWLMEVQEGHPENDSTLAFNFLASYLAVNFLLPLIPVIIFGLALNNVKKFANENQDETLVMN